MTLRLSGAQICAYLSLGLSDRPQIITDPNTIHIRNSSGIRFRQSANPPPGCEIRSRDRDAA